MRTLALFVLLCAAPAAAEPVMVFSAGGDRILFGPGDIVIAEAQTHPELGNVVSLLMSPAKGRAFTEITRSHIGEKVDIHVCGALIISPRVLSPILGGSIYLTSGKDMDGTRALAEKLKSGRCGAAGRDGQGADEGEGRPST